MDIKIWKQHQADLDMTRWVIGVICAMFLFLIFLFQRLDVSAFLGLALSPPWDFIFNRSIRFLMNDLFTIGLIFALFNSRPFLIFSIYVQLFGLFFILIPYFIVKLNFPSYNGPLINFVHRLILNPLLLLLLIPAFYYQKKYSSNP